MTMSAAVKVRKRLVASVRRRMSMSGPMQSMSVAASTPRTTAQVIPRQRARAAARSAGDTSASSTNVLSRAGTTNRNGVVVVAGAAAPTRSVTGTTEVCMTNVSTRPGASSVSPSDCSTTTVAARTPFADTGSTRIRRGPSALGTITSAGGPCTRGLGRSDTRPAQASGAAVVSQMVTPVRRVSLSGNADAARSKRRRMPV